MNDDFNTPGALAVLFEMATDLNRTKSVATAALLRALGATLGVLQQSPQAFLQAGAALTEDEIQSRIAARAQAKKDQNFAESRSHPQGARGPRHHAEGRPRRHHLGEGLTWSAVPAGAAVPESARDVPGVLGRRLPSPGQARPGDEEADPQVRRRAAAEQRRRVHHAGALHRRAAGVHQVGAGRLAQAGRGRRRPRRRAAAARRRARAGARDAQGRRPVGAQGRVPERPGPPFQRRRRARGPVARHGRRGHHRGTGGHPRHRPLDGRDVPDLPSAASERASAGRSGPDPRNQRKLLQRRAGLARRGPRTGRRVGSVPLGRHVVSLAQPGSAATAEADAPLNEELTDDQTPFPGIRATDRRAGIEDRRAALRAERVGRRHLRGDRPPRQEEPAAHQGHLLQPAARGRSTRSPATRSARRRSTTPPRCSPSSRNCTATAASRTTPPSSAASRASTARPA